MVLLMSYIERNCVFVGEEGRGGGFGFRNLEILFYFDKFFDRFSIFGNLV